MKFYIAGMGNFALFCSCGLDLDPTTFVYELDSYSLKISPRTKKMNFLRKGFRSLGCIK